MIRQVKLIHKGDIEIKKLCFDTSVYVCFGHHLIFELYVVIVYKITRLTSPSICEAAQDFVCTLYDSDGLSTTGQSSNNNVDLVRMDSFCRRTKDVERIPPTSDSLMLHLKCSVYQSSIWASAFLEVIPEEDPEQYGWQVEDGKLVPIWMTLPLAKDVFHLEIKCSCTKQCANCKCIKNKLKCTRMCKCKCIQ